MPLFAVQVENLRCLRSADLQLDPQLTVITGPNASGKTSLLEAVFFLGRGRSFRSRQAERLIRTGAEALTVIGHVENTHRPIVIGIRATRERTEARIAGSPIDSLAPLASAFPVQVIDPGVHKLVEEGPAGRRRALDWGVFHVERRFAADWQRYQRALKQRNAALRSQLAAASVRAWDPELISAGSAMTDARSRYAARLQPVVRRIASDLADVDLTIAMSQGWPVDESFGGALERAWVQDCKAATTTVGPHRADLRIRVEGYLARDRVSRGQQKLVAAALVLAQLEVLQETSGMAGTLLLDDPAAELDGSRLRRLLEAATKLGAQLIATATSEGIVGLENPGARFHVEQGAVTRML